MSGKTGPWRGGEFSGWPAGESSSWAMGLSVGSVSGEVGCVVESCSPIVVPGVGNLEISSSLVALPRVGR